MQKQRLTDGYLFKGFKPYQVVHEILGDSSARVIKLKRLLKKRDVRSVGKDIEAITMRRRKW